MNLVKIVAIIAFILSVSADSAVEKRVWTYVNL